MENNFDVVIIGAGIIGTAICDELVTKGLKVALLEKNPRIAEETTEGNSGVIHGGFDPTPGKLNAKLNIEGRKIYQDKWFKELDFPWKKTDSLVIAFNETEKTELTILYQRGIKNGLAASEMKLLNKAEVLELEPNINQEVLGALLCNVSYVVDPVMLTYSLWNRAKQTKKAQLFVNHKVIKIDEKDKNFNVTCQNENNQLIHFNTKIVINCAGHYSDEIANMIGSQDFHLTARRGQYCILEKTEANVINNHVIFLVPTIHGKGIIVAPMLDGHVLVGPTAEENIAKEDTRLISLEKVADIKEIGKKIIPSLNTERVTKVISGSRPICKETNDFIIEYAKNNHNFINISGIKSPGLSAAPAIALHVSEMVEKLKIK